MSASAVSKRAAGSAKRSRKPAGDVTPVTKNELQSWDFIAEVLYSEDFAKIFTGSGEIVGWALTSPPGSTQYAFNVVLSGPRAKNIFNYSIDLGGPRTTSFNSMAAFYKKMRTIDEKLPKVLSPCNVAILWERTNGDNVETRVINMLGLVKAFRNKVKKDVDGAKLLLNAFEYGLAQVTPAETTPTTTTTASKKRRSSLNKEPVTDAAVNKSTDETEEKTPSAPSAKKRKRPDKVQTAVEDTPKDATETEPEQNNVAESSDASKPRSPPRKKIKVVSGNTPIAVDTRTTEALALAVTSLVDIAKVFRQSIDCMRAIATTHDETSLKVMEALLRMESENAKRASDKRDKRRSVKSDEDSGSESDDMGVDPDVPLTPPSPRGIDEKTVEKSSTGRPLRQARNRPLIDDRDMVDDMNEIYPSDDDEKKKTDEESESEYDDDAAADFITEDTEPEIDEVDDGDEEADENEEEDSDDDMEVDDMAPPRKPYLKNAGSGSTHAPQYADSSPDDNMHIENSMEDKVYNDDNDTLGAAPSSRTTKAPPIPKATPAVAPKSTVKKATSGSRKPLNIITTKVAPKSLPPARQANAIVNTKSSSALSASSKPFHVLTPPVEVAQAQIETCDDVINSVVDDDDDVVDM